jgi:hypothetical protein
MYHEPSVLSPEQNRLNRGAIQIAGLYLLIGGLWILFSDRLAARVALNEEMLTLISLYKGWACARTVALLADPTAHGCPAASDCNCSR